MEIFNEFGIQPVLLAAQVVNFLVLLFILKRFLYKPVLKMLDERKAKIAKSLEEAAEIEARLQKTAEEQGHKLKEADKQAKSIIEDASKTAAKIVEDAQTKATVEIERMIAKTKAQLEAERTQLHQEIREELSDLVVIGIEKVVGKVLSEKDKKELVEKSVKSLQ